MNVIWDEVRDKRGKRMREEQILQLPWGTTNLLDAIDVSGIQLRVIDHL